MNSPSSTSPSCSSTSRPNDSGYPRQAFTTITSQTEKDALLAKIASFHIINDKSNNASTAEAFYEAWLWFRGERVHLGNKTVSKNDSNAFIDGTARTTYKSPGIGCAKNHIIYLANGAPADKKDVSETPEADQSVGDANRHPDRRGRQRPTRPTGPTSSRNSSAAAPT